MGMFRNNDCKPKKTKPNPPYHPPIVDVETGNIMNEVEMTLAAPGLAPPQPQPIYSTATSEPDDLLKQRTQFSFVFISISTLATLTICNSIYLLAGDVINTILAYIVLGSTLVIAPYSAYARWRLQSLDGFLEVENRIRREVNRLTVENVRLTRSINKLESNVQDFSNENVKLQDSITDLSYVEQSMSDLASSANVSVAAMQSLIDQNKNVLVRTEIIQKQTQALCTSMSMQNLFSLILQCDVDGTGDFSAHELSLIAGGMRGLEPDFREDVFYRVIERKRRSLGIEKNTIAGMMDVARNMLNVDIPEGDRIIAKKTTMTRSDLPPTVVQSLKRQTIG
ncbi:hypothetical protein ScalyP_jg10491 [Parmales sp. scaly parma]|nr:hypothetical protein ScalyP_jg10491 [Parmales sp. scaly parma]|tara:strand:- start:455 stop:1468 length:1014 start_codon:yes stop_codon:yes gene_type:complete